MNELEIIAPAVVSIVLVLTVGGVILLRPLSKRLGELLEAMVAEKRQGHPGLEAQLGQIREQLESQGDRLTLLEERLEFTERLVERRPPGKLSAGEGVGGAPAESPPSSAREG